MKKYPTVVVYPTTKQEEERWGFDVYKPNGTPRAWIIDWDSVSVGFGLTPEKMQAMRDFKFGEDLSQLSAGELFAGCSLMAKYYWNSEVNYALTKYSEDTVKEFVRSVGGPMYGSFWVSMQKKYGSPVPLDKAAWYQDAVHMQYGPTMQAYTWFDDEKVVCTRSMCTRRPPKGMERNAKFCRAHDDATIEGYMSVEPKLFAVRVPDLGDDGKGQKCVHMWTYNKAVIDNLPDNLKKAIPDTVRKILKSKGAQV